MDPREVPETASVYVCSHLAKNRCQTPVTQLKECNEDAVERCVDRIVRIKGRRFRVITAVRRLPRIAGGRPPPVVQD